jgi:hypothetical protein
MATLDEVAVKVAKLIAQIGPAPDISKIVEGVDKVSEKNGPMRIRPLPNAGRKTSR